MIGILYIVATPIGNLQDISFRALETLKQVDLILSEDTRKTRILCQQFDINTPLKSFHLHNERQLLSMMIGKLKIGQSLAIVSDAGTPLISDPGYLLVRECQEQSIRIVPIPGANAVTTALCASGLVTNTFTFIGFLQRTKSKRIKQLKTYDNRLETLIFFETSKRIINTIEDMIEVFGETRKICLSKELTKVFETIVTMSLVDLQGWLLEDEYHQKGELVLIVSGKCISDDINIDLANEKQLKSIINILSPELPITKVAKIVSKLTGIDRKICYQIASKL